MEFLGIIAAIILIVVFWRVFLALGVVAIGICAVLFLIILVANAGGVV